MIKKIIGKTIVALSIILMSLGTISIVANAEEDNTEEIMEEFSVCYTEEAMGTEEEVLPIELILIENKVACYSSDYNGNKLSGINKQMYDAAKERAEKIAKGEASSSVITIDISSNPYAGRMWSLSEAGISSWIGSDGYMSKDGVQFIYQQIGYDPSLVIDALKNDCPYEMYWAGLSYGSNGFSVTSDRTKCGIGSTLTLSISVSVDYATSSAYTVDTKKTSSIAIARDNVLNIVEANKDKSDYDKLRAYAIKISELADYNYDAVNNNAPYGDPWQLVYVFDNNPDTNVVCEGFSKAFQYLVENSTFESDELYSIIVDGRTTGNHMWNIVHMGDGQNYVVDITACEQWHRSLGPNYLDKAFMNYAVSGDVNTGYVIKREHSVGTPTYTYSADTKKLYSEEELTISRTPYALPCKTHTFTDVVDAKYLVNNANCTSPAVYYKSCSVCKEKSTETFTKGSALGHKWDEGTITTAPTEHTTGVRTYKCTRSGCIETKTEIIPELEHTTHVYDQKKEESKYLKEAQTCTTSAIYYKSCACGEKGTETFTSSVTPPGHIYKQVVDNKYLKSPATCTSKAIYYKSCKCGDKLLSETFTSGDTLPHTYNQEIHTDKYIAKEATCYSKANYYKSCVCGAKSTSVTFEYGSLKAHVWDDGTITKYPTESIEGELTYKCRTDGCDAKKSESIPRLNHTHVYNKLVRESKYLKSPATCHNQATYYKSCECGEAGKTTFTYGDYLEHNWDKGTITKQPTTEDSGIKTYHCSNEGCSETKEEILPKVDGYADGKKDYEDKYKSSVERFVCRIYTDCLGRKPEDDGVKYWSNELKNGNRDGASVGAGFVFSAEYMDKGTTKKEYVMMLYKVFMGREADEGGLNYWIENMKNGMTREEVFKGFVDSQEYTLLCKAYGINRGDYKVQGITDPVVKNGKVTPEIKRYVERIYEKALNRESDPSGIDYWSQEIANEAKDPVWVAELFIFSEEFENRKLNDKDYIKVLYRTFMGREADNDGMNYWLGRMKNGDSRKTVLEAFAGCKEFQDIIKGFGL